jgi:hypothetical protein
MIRPTRIDLRTGRAAISVETCLHRADLYARDSQDVPRIHRRRRARQYLTVRMARLDEHLEAARRAGYPGDASVVRLTNVADALGARRNRRRGSILRAGSNPNSHTVQGHATRSGTQLRPYVATNPNSTQRDNYSATDNVNPYPGAVGTRNPRY